MPSDSEDNVASPSDLPGNPSDSKTRDPSPSDPEKSTPPDLSDAGPIIIVDSQTRTLPPIIEPTTIVTLDHTFTFDTPQDSQATTLSTIVISSGKTVPFPGTRPVITATGSEAESGDTTAAETVAPSRKPSGQPGDQPGSDVVGSPIQETNQESTQKHTQEPTQDSSQEPSQTLSQEPIQKPTQKPTQEPTQEPTTEPTQEPSKKTSQKPSQEPSQEPTRKLSNSPDQEPSHEPTHEPTQEPNQDPTQELDQNPSQELSHEPTRGEPSQESIQEPTQQLSQNSSQERSRESTEEPSQKPTQEPTQQLSQDPSQEPTQESLQSTPILPTPSDNGEDVVSSVAGWPAAVTITPMPTDVDQPRLEEEEDKDEDDDGDNFFIAAIIPCKLWFFNICPKFGNINFGGWRLPLPPGIYPPGPPPILLPLPFELHGTLPPWPQFTVGPDHIPTFPSAPEPTDCEAQTASLCYATTSYVVSTLDSGAVETVSSVVPPASCTEIHGCVVRDSDEESAVTRTAECPAETATDIVVTCSDTGTAACSSKTEVVRTGCSLTATTTTVFCTPAPSGNVRRQEADDSGTFCPVMQRYVIYPRDRTNLDEAAVALAQMRATLGGDDRVEDYESRRFSVDFWRATMTEDEAQAIREIPNIAGVFLEGTGSFDPTDTWVFQPDYKEVMSNDLMLVEHYLIGQQQLAYFSMSEHGDKTWDDVYVFDDSAGSGIPVYVVDTGAQLNHIEFTEGNNIASKVNWLFVDENDFDGPARMDDSSTQVDGSCFYKPEACKLHGTSMLAFITGAHLGVSKNVEPWVVRMPRRNEKGLGATPGDWLRGVTMINEKITEKTDVTQAIVSLSWAFPLDSFGAPGSDDCRQWRLSLYKQIQLLIEKGVLVVVGSGNTKFMVAWPALFGATPGSMETNWGPEPPYIPDLLVVGAADTYDGNRWIDSGIAPDKGLPHIYAPGENVVGVQGNKALWEDKSLGKEYRNSRGTSTATAYASGLAAYFLRLHQLGILPPDSAGNPPDMSPAGLKRYMIDKSWSRHDNTQYGPIRGVWNTVNYEEIITQGRICPYEAADTMRTLRRQDDECLLGSGPAAGPVDDDTPTTARPASGTDDTSTAAEPASTPTGFRCTEETADQCAPAVICGGRQRNGCVDGKCVCLTPEMPTTTFVTITTSDEDPLPTLPPEVANGDCPEMIVTRCNGSGARKACQDVTVCGPPPPAPTDDGKPDRCRIHVRELAWGLKHEVKFWLDAYVNGDVVGKSGKIAGKWGKSITWAAADSGFPVAVQIELAESRSPSKRDHPGPKGDRWSIWQSWDLGFTAGPTEWSSGKRDESRKPFCRVGGWDNSQMGNVFIFATDLWPNRQMDCYWEC